jgi:hypothetical protein
MTTYRSRSNDGKRLHFATTENANIGGVEALRDTLRRDESIMLSYDFETDFKMCGEEIL